MNLSKHEDVYKFNSISFKILIKVHLQYIKKLEREIWCSRILQQPTLLVRAIVHF